MTESSCSSVPWIATIGHRFPDATVESTALADHGVAVRSLGGLSKSDALAQAADADAVLLGIAFSLDDASMAELRKCQVIVRYGVGLDNVDVEAAARRGILVRNVPDYGIEEVANHSLALLIGLARRLDVLNSRVRAGRWSDALAGLQIQRLSESTLLVVGGGRIGRALATRAAAIWGRILVYDILPLADANMPPNVTFTDDLDRALTSARFLSLHVPGSAATHHLLDARRLAMLPNGCIIVNCSRGDVIDEAALLSALESGHVAAAGLDVFANEPNPDPRLLAHDNVWATPHAAWFSASAVRDLRAKAAVAAASALASLCSGGPNR